MYRSNMLSVACPEKCIASRTEDSLGKWLERSGLSAALPVTTGRKLMGRVGFEPGPRKRVLTITPRATNDFCDFAQVVDSRFRQFLTPPTGTRSGTHLPMDTLVVVVWGLAGR